jgi:Ca2+-transporting ATPase
MKDPIRDGIKDAVTRCSEGGVTVRMVTGDNKTTAISIAKDSNIIDPNWEPSEQDYTVMEGN